MEKKKNIGLFVIVGVLVVLILVLVLLFSVLLWNGFTHKNNREGRSQTSSQIDTGKNVDSEEMHFIQTGYEFTVPGEYNMTYADVAGTVIYQENGFQMRMAVVDHAYEEVMANPETFTQATIDAGGSVEQDMTETELDGKKYAYYLASLQGDKMLIIYTAAPDAEQRIAGQIVFQGENVSNDDMIKMFANIACSAVKTDEADSTKDDIVVEMADKKENVESREWLGERAMTFGDVSITHTIPDNFYLDISYEGSEYVAEIYTMSDPYISVTCTLFNIPWYADVQDYIERNQHLDDTKIQTMEIDGKKVHYIMESFINGEEEYQQIYAGIDLGEHQFYVVEAYMTGEDEELEMDTIREFLVIE